MASFADYRERRSPSRRTVRVPLDGDLRAQAVQLREQLAAARQTAWATLAQPGDSDQDTLEAQLADLEQQLQEDAAEFTFVAVSYAELEAIKLACPPSADQPDAPWDPATFGPALVAATCVDPPLSDSEAGAVPAVGPVAGGPALRCRLGRVQQPRSGAPFIERRFRSDARYRAELTYCAQRGIPHSVFLSWDPADQEKALVWLYEEGQRCGRCNTYTWEWQYQDNDGNWRMRDDVHREADLWTCVGCHEMDTLHDHATGGGRQPLGHGSQVRWFPKTTTKEQ